MKTTSFWQPQTVEGLGFGAKWRRLIPFLFLAPQPSYLSLAHLSSSAVGLPSSFIIFAADNLLTRATSSLAVDVWSRRPHLSSFRHRERNPFSSSSISIGERVPSARLRATTTDDKLGLAERALSAAGAAFLSAVLVNPLDVAKTRLQAQAAGVQEPSLGLTRYIFL